MTYSINMEFNKCTFAINEFSSVDRLRTFAKGFQHPFVPAIPLYLNVSFHIVILFNM